MALTQPDLVLPIRDALVANSDVSDQLATYLGAEAIFTRRPAPPDADYPMVMISPDLSRVDDGFLTAEHLNVLRDIAVYGRNDTPQRYRTVEVVAFNIFDLFHRKPRAITVDGWKVLNIWASGPRVAPDDDDHIVGRLVELRIELIAAMT